MPVFKITSKVSSTLNLNTPNSTVTYTITILNDGDASYSADAQGIFVFNGLPEGLRLASDPKMSVDNGAGITSGNQGEGNSSFSDSIVVSSLNLKVGEKANIKFDVQRDTDEPLAAPKNTINHATVKLDLGDGQTIYDTTDPLDSKQNTKDFYPTTDDSEVINGSSNNTIGGDSAAPLVANQRAIDIDSATKKEIPTSTSATTQVIHSAVINNKGQETEGDTVGEVKFTIIPKPDSKVTVVTGSVELVYDADNDPSTANDTYTIARDSNGYNDLTTAKPKNGAPAWTGMAPGSTVTINYTVESNKAVMGSTETTTITLIIGGEDVPTAGTRVVNNTTIVKGLLLAKTQALNESCLATATLKFTGTGTPVTAQPNDCIVYKITAFNNFSTADARFTFNDTIISDAISQFKNKAQVLSSTTTPAFAIKLGDVDNESAEPATNKYDAAVDATKVSGTVTSLAPQKYAAMMFAIKINPDGATTTTP